MSRLSWLPFRSLVVCFSLGLVACGGSGSSDPGGGGTGGTVVPFCVTDEDCAGGASNECQAATCDIEAGVCVNEPLPDGSACNDAAGVCRDGFCAATELKAFVKSPRPEPNALFGTSVSILGDRMLVGSPSSGPPFGSVGVFERADDQWSVVQEIDTPPLGQSCGDGLFGWSVAVAEQTLVVGSLGFGLGGIGSVRVFIQNRLTGNWNQESAGTQRGCLRGLDTDPLDLFGNSVALTPVSEIGQTLVVGAPGHSSGEAPIAVADRDYSGAIYIFEKINSVDWTQPGPTKASNAGGTYECIACEEFACPTSGEGDGFGASVAISGNTIVVGAPGEGSAATGVNGDENDDSAPGAGAAYVFENIDDEWVQTAYLKASNTDAGDRFGFAVAIHGDTIVVGAEREDSDQVDNQGANAGTPESNGLDCEAGAAYVFERSGGVWEQTQYLKASNVACGYFFGAMLSVNDTNLVVGSPGESSIGGVNSGGAYVFSLVEGEWAQTNFYKAFNADAESAFAGPPGTVAYGTPSSLVSCEVQSTIKGSSMSLSGDTLVVGTPYEDSPGIGVNGTPSGAPIPNSGAVYIFDNSEGQ
jgi:hypothetical protein